MDWGKPVGYQGRARRMARSESNAILARIVPVTSACDRLSQVLVIDSHNGL